MLSNLLVGRHRHSTTQLWQELLFLPSVRTNEKAHRRRVEQVIEFLDLEAHRDKLISGLPYGVRKVIELARALCSEPKLILLDEPSSGLNVEETDDMSFWIRDMKTELGVTVLMVEHDMTLVNRVSDRVIALNYGRVIAMARPPRCSAIPTSSQRIWAHEDDAMSAPASSQAQQYRELLWGRSWPSEASASKCRAPHRHAVGRQRRRQDHGAETISGILDPQKGSIEFMGKPIQRMEADRSCGWA